MWCHLHISLAIYPLIEEASQDIEQTEKKGKKLYISNRMLNSTITLDYGKIGIWL